MTLIGDFITREDIEVKTLAHVRRWIEYYLGRIEEAKSLEAHTLATPRSWRVTEAFSRRPEDALPYVDVVSIGTERGRRPQRDGDGAVRAWWSVAVGAAVTANDQQKAKNLAGYYGTAIMLLMTQYPDLGEWAEGVEWVGEAFDDWPITGERTIATVREIFTVEVHGVMNVFQAPFHDSLSPPEDSYAFEPEPSQVSTVDFDVERMS